MLSFPLRLAPNGALATVEQASPDGAAEELAQLILTRRGERPLVPAYGLEDPVAAGVDAGELAALVELFGPPVTLLDVGLEPASETTAALQVVFV